ncbi:hypothetical protein ACWGQ5_19285 [Streptomyces sp. NPDC055722]
MSDELPSPDMSVALDAPKNSAIVAECFWGPLPSSPITWGTRTRLG